MLASLGKIAHSDTAKTIAKLILPLIALAEFCSWSAVITTDFLGNVLENSLWTMTFGAARVRGAARDCDYLVMATTYS